MAPSKQQPAMMATDTTYGMSMDMPIKGKTRRHRRANSNHSEDADAEDGSASLTYSAGSSIASSAAGESTDSSFADIMKVLDVQDSNELAAFMKREGVTDPSQFQRKSKASTMSVGTESLAYSTDGSALEGVQLLQTITGQPSDSYGPDGGGFGDLGNDILFAAADEPVKRKGSRKDRSSRSSPKGSRNSKRTKSGSSGSKERTSEPSTPPPPVPRLRSNTEEDEDEVWYAKWWMCGFADSFRDLVPKR
jgi:hypothetical protein